MSRAEADRAAEPTVAELIDEAATERQVRDRTEERADRLQQLTAHLAAALTPEQVAEGALLPALSVLEAESAALLLREPGPPPALAVAGSTGYPAELIERWRRLPLDNATPAGAAVLAGEPVYLASVEEGRRRFPDLFDGPAPPILQAWAAVPLRSGTEVIGALAVGIGGRREFAPEERRYLETVAAQCALAVERSRLYGTVATERERLAAVLARLPVGVIIGEAPHGRLVLGNAEVERIWRHPFLAAVEVGEYDAYRGFHPDGRPYLPTEWPLARSLATGEVVTGEEVDVARGDGTRGTIMVNSAPMLDAAGAVTAAVCTFLDVTDRTESRRRLDAAYAAEQQARAAAEAAGERLGRLQHHPAVDSLEVGGDSYGVVALPAGRVGLVVGDVVGRGLDAATTMGKLRSALAALALTGEAPAQVLDGLAAAVVEAGTGPDWSDALVARMLAGAGDDDVALLSAAYAPELAVRVPARGEELAGVRRRLRTWLAAVGATGDGTADVLLAAGEATANAVEHAFPDGPGEVAVELRLAAGRELTVRVSDTGRWLQEPAPGDRGRGLSLMRAVAESVQVESGTEGTVGGVGTVVTMRFRLGERA